MNSRRTGPIKYAQGVRVARAFLAGVVIAVAATSCSVPAPVPGGPAGTAPQQSASASSTALQSPAAPSAADDPAARMAATVEATLKDVAAQTPKPGQEQLRSALVAAGVPAETLEVSAGRTPTGLEVDAIEVGARSGERCVMGQVRDGAVAVSVLPLLSSGKCFVGDSR